MGWLWTSSPTRESGETKESALPPQTPKDSKWGLSEEQRKRIFGKSGVLQENDESRDKTADKELETFLDSLSNPQPTTTTTTQETAPTSIEPELHSRILPDGTLNIGPSAMYPRTMSCRQAFDQAFYCQSLGGKFNDIYRFGSLQSCSEHWGAFWFCMRTKSLPREEKEGQIRDYYAARDQRKRKEFGGGSERVWDVREKAVERAFWRDPDGEGED